MSTAAPIPPTPFAPATPTPPPSAPGDPRPTPEPAPPAADSPPRRHPELIITRRVDDRGSTIVYNPLTGRHLRLGRGAGDLLLALDGRPANGRFDPDTRATAMALDGFRRHRLLDDSAAEAAVEPGGSQRRLRVTGTASLQLDLLDPSPVLARWRPWLERLAALPVGRALIVLVASGAAAAMVASDVIAVGLSSTGTTTMLVTVAGTLLFAVLTHQTARALTLTAVGGTVRRVGVAVRCLLPRLFLDLTDACLVLRAGQRQAVSRSGSAGNAVVASLAAMVILVTGDAVPWLTTTLSWTLVVNLAAIAAVLALSPITTRPVRATSG